MFHHPAINQKTLIVTVIEVSLEQMGNLIQQIPSAIAKGGWGGNVFIFSTTKEHKSGSESKNSHSFFSVISLYKLHYKDRLSKSSLIVKY